MSRKIIYSDKAMIDLVDCAYYIGETSLSASKRFTKAAGAAFAQLAERPGIGVLRDFGNPDYSNMRMWPMPGFAKYLIFYCADDEEVEILRVLHGSRDIHAIFTPEEQE